MKRLMKLAWDFIKFLLAIATIVTLLVYILHMGSKLL